MIDSFFEFLQNINNNYANVLLLGVAVISAFVAYNEYVSKRRPYVVPEIVIGQVDGNWEFAVLLVNKGERPGIARITKAILKIGDEEYPTVFKIDTILAPNEEKRLAPIGHINELGRNKIVGHEYISNRVEIILEIQSRSIGDKNFKYKTSAEYYVDVAGNKPILSLTKEAFE